MIAPRPPGVPLLHPPRAGMIRLEGVSFRYRAAARPALSDVTCHFRPGELVGLLGRSGAGRSTLAGDPERHDPPSHARGFRRPGVDRGRGHPVQAPAGSRRPHRVRLPGLRVAALLDQRHAGGGLRPGEPGRGPRGDRAPDGSVPAPGPPGSPREEGAGGALGRPEAAAGPGLGPGPHAPGPGPGRADQRSGPGGPPGSSGRGPDAAAGSGSHRPDDRPRHRRDGLGGPPDRPGRGTRGDGGDARRAVAGDRPAGRAGGQGVHAGPAGGRPRPARPVGERGRSRPGHPSRRLAGGAGRRGATASGGSRRSGGGAGAGGGRPHAPLPGRHRGPLRGELHDSPGRVRGDPGTERQREDHAGQASERDPQARLRRDPAAGKEPRRPAGQPDQPPGGAGVPEPGPSDLRRADPGRGGVRPAPARPRRIRGRPAGGGGAGGGGSVRHRRPGPLRPHQGGSPAGGGGRHPGDQARGHHPGRADDGPRPPRTAGHDGARGAAEPGGPHHRDRHPRDGRRRVLRPAGHPDAGRPDRGRRADARDLRAGGSDPGDGADAAAHRAGGKPARCAGAYAGGAGREALVKASTREPAEPPGATGKA